jgi:hypothetical protein
MLNLAQIIRKVYFIKKHSISIHMDLYVFHFESSQRFQFSFNDFSLVYRCAFAQIFPRSQLMRESKTSTKHCFRISSNSNDREYIVIFIKKRFWFLEYFSIALNCILLMIELFKFLHSICPFQISKSQSFDLLAFVNS